METLTQQNRNSLDYSTYKITEPPTIIPQSQKEVMDKYALLSNDEDIDDAKNAGLLLGLQQLYLNNKPITSHQIKESENTEEALFNNNLNIINSFFTNLSKTQYQATRKEVSDKDIQKFVNGHWNTIKGYMNILINDCGATIAEAAGIGGNIYGESGFNENAKGDGGKSTGLFQMDNWNWTQFREMCNKNNWDPSSNVSLFKYVYNTASKKKDQYNNASKDPIEAMYWLCNTFEKPNPKKANYQAREQAALAIYNHLLDDITGKTQVRPVLNVTGERLVNYGRENLLGGKYVSGGKYYPLKGLDCSGFTYLIYKAFGYDIGLSTYDQMKQGTNIGKDLSKALPGDLVILASSASPSNQHVEMITRVEPNGQVWSMGARGVDSRIKESVFPFKASAIKTIRRIV